MPVTSIVTPNRAFDDLLRSWAIAIAFSESASGRWNFKLPTCSG
jgi:hypothetical protein